MIIIPVHGYNVSDNGAGSVDTFTDALTGAGHSVLTHYADYGWIGLFTTRFGGIRSIAAGLARRIEEDFEDGDEVVLLCHSNGFAIAYECIKKTNKVDTIISFNGALDDDVVFSPNVKHIYNFYAPADKVLKWGAWLRPMHIWGRAGQSGLTDNDPRIVNIEMPDVRQHSSVFQVKALREKYSRWVVALLPEQPHT